MSRFMKVEGHNDLVRDNQSGAILNINTNELEQRRKIKAARKKKDDEVASLKKEVGDLKKMLAQVLERLDG